MLRTRFRDLLGIQAPIIIDKLLPFAGQSAGTIRNILTAEEIIKQFVADAERMLGNAARLAA